MSGTVRILDIPSQTRPDGADEFLQAVLTANGQSEAETSDALKWREREVARIARVGKNPAQLTDPVQEGENEEDDGSVW